MVCAQNLAMSLMRIRFVYKTKKTFINILLSYLNI